MLVILAGLPGTGKTTIARALTREIDAVHLRVDTIEQAVVRAGAGSHPLGPVGYVIAYALAEDLLRQGLTVVAESVNPVHETRQAWRDVARAARADHLDVEVVCSDPAEHERRAANRASDIPDLPLPTWSDITGRDYQPWDRNRLVLDTARRTVADCVATVRDLLHGSRAAPTG